MNSKFWKNMFVFRKSSPSSSNIIKGQNDKIISENEPEAFPLNLIKTDDLILSSYIHTNTIIEKIEPFINEIVEFLKKNNCMYTGVYELIDYHCLKHLLSNTNAYLYILRYKKTNAIMGIMLASMLSIGDRTFALTYCLCIHRQLRNNGLCMMLIRTGLKDAHKNGVLCGYYLEPKPISDCAIKLERWMRPINVKSALSHGYNFVMPKKSEKLKTKYAYSINKNPKYKIKRSDFSDIKNTHEFILSFGSQNRFQWTPTLEEWEKWTINNEAFQTLICYNNNEKIEGLFTLHIKQIFIPDTQCISNVVFVTYHLCLSANECLETLSHYVLTQLRDIDVMYLFESGQLTRQVLENNKAVETGEMYFDFYNYHFNALAKDINVPFL